jgi:hypothetical protein
VSTKRRPRQRGKRLRITPEMIRLFALAREIHGGDGYRKREREYLDACEALHAALGRELWAIDIVDTIGSDMPPAHETAEHWAEAVEIRRALEEAAAR